MGSIEANGFKMRDVECRSDQGGPLVGAALVAALAKKKAPLAACARGKQTETTIHWTAEKGVVKTITATGTSDAANKCVQRTLTRAASPGVSECEGTIVH